MSAGFDPETGLGPRLRVAREERQWSVRELARRIGCSASLVSQIERGVSVPSVGVLYALATELGTSLDHLVLGAPGPLSPWPAAVPAQEPGGPLGSGRPDSGRPGSGRPGSGRESPGIVVRAGGRAVIELASGVRWERLTPGPDALTDYLAVVYSPGGHSSAERRPLRHDGREYGLVVSGTLQANVGFEHYELGPGDSIAFDSATPHEFVNETAEVVHAIWVVVRA